MTSGKKEPGREGSAQPQERAVYVISVAAELAGVHPQTLRFYERKGLLNPARTRGNTRRYSDADVARLRAIQEMTQRRGINLAGAKLIMEMQAQLEQMHAELDRMRRELAHAERPVRRTAVGTQLVPLRSVPRFPWEAIG